MKLLAASLLILLLSACVGTDPYSQIAAGQAALQATQVARSVSAEQTKGAMSAAVIEQTRYAGEVLALEAQVRGTQEAIGAEQTAVSVQATRSAADLQATAARATAGAVEMQVTQAYQVWWANSLSTATAIASNREIAATKAVAEARREQNWKNLWLIFIGGLVLALFAWLAALIYGFVILTKAKAYVKRKDADRSYIASTVTQAQLPESLPEQDSTEGTIQFLYQAACVVGKSASQIPSDGKMGWSAGPWSRETRRLSMAGAVYVQANKGTFVKLPWRNIDGLYQAITTGKLALPPYPGRGDRQYYAENGNGNGNGVQI